MVPEAPLETTDSGLVPKGEGWFVVNAKEARWFEHEKFGSGTGFEGEPEFSQLGINIGVLEPGQPACMYHRENQQEDFLVLFGECLLVVEGQERPLKSWDFVHCPPETNHVFVGAGDGPCGILPIGHRPPRDAAQLGYPVDETARKRFRAAEVERPFLRGPARLAEVMTLLPQMRRALPEARLPFERPRVLGAMLGSAVAAQVIKTSRLRPLAQELLAGALSLAPAALAVRGSEVAAYHGAEHISIGSYEHGETRAKEHERCGSHIVGPLLVSSAVGGALAARAPEHLRGPARAAAQLGAVGVATELFSWMVRNPDRALS